MSRSALILASVAVVAAASAAAVLQRQQPAAAQPAERPSARATFGVTGAPIGACLLSVDPSRQAVGQAVDLSGRRFGSGGEVEFSALSGGFTAATSTGAWSATAVADARVPSPAANGTVRVNPASASPSNELSFRVLRGSGSGPGGGGDPESCAGPAACGADIDCSNPPNSLPPTVYGCSVPQRCCQLRPRVVDATPRFDSPSVCLNGSVVLQFNAPINPSRGRNPSIVRFERSADGGSTWSSVDASRAVAGNVLTVSPRSCAMSAGQLYRVYIVGDEDGVGLTTRNGVSMICDGSWASGAPLSLGGCQGTNYILGFTADPAGGQCTIASLQTLPTAQSVGITEQATFTGVGRSASGQSICTNSVSWSILAPSLGVTGSDPADPDPSFTATAGTEVGVVQVQGTAPGPIPPGVSTLNVTAGSPRVVGSGSCSAGQSPSPQPGRTDACINSMVQARFTMPMNPGSIAAGLDVLRCGTGGAFDFATCGSAVAGTSEAQADRLLFTPSSDLQPDTWYWVGVPPNARARADLGGRVLADLNFDSDPAVNPGNDMYAWSFKTRAGGDRCALDGVSVDPESHVFTAAGATWDFVSHAESHSQCSIIVAPQSWTWNVLNSGIASIDSSSENRARLRSGSTNGATELQARLAGFSTPASADIRVQLPNPLRLGQVTGGNCRNSVITAEFTRTLNPATVPGSISVEEFNGADWVSIGATVRVTAAGYGRTIVTLTPPGLLSTSSSYRLIVWGMDNPLTPAVVEGIRDSIGQGLQDSDGNFVAFEARPLGTPPRPVCSVSRVEVTRNAAPVATDTFLCGGRNNCGGDDDGVAAGNQHRFRAQARAASGDVVAATYRWSVPRGGTLVSLAPSPAVAQDVSVTAGSQNGSATMVVDASNEYGGARGSVGLRLFLCANPWPSANAAGVWGPFVDNDTGFSLFYCRDDGNPATVDDDLPALPDPTRRNTTGDLFREIVFLPGSGGGVVEPLNRPPYIDHLPAVTVDENELISFYVNAHDPEGDTLSFAPSAGFSNLTWEPLSPAGPQVLNLGDAALFTWRPGPTQGGSTPGGFIDYYATFHVRDSAGDIGHSNPVLIRVMDTSLPEPPPAPPVSLAVTFVAGDPEHAQANVSWSSSTFADTYRVYRRDDGAAGGGDDDEDISYRSADGSLLRRLVGAIRGWVGRLVSPVARALNIPVGLAAAADITPVGSYVEVAVPPVPAGSCGARCGFSDTGAPVSRRLCYVVKACNEAGCSGFSAPACGDAPPPNTLPTARFVSPATSGQRIALGAPFTFSVQLAEADAGDYIASYRWNVDGTWLPASTGDFGSGETVDLTRTFDSAGLHTVGIRVADSNGASPAPDASVQVDAQANAAPNACIINPTGPLPAWCNT